MNINLNTNADIAAKLKAYGYSKAEPKTEAGTSAHLNGQRDQVILSLEGQEAAVQSADPFYKLESAVMSEDFKEIAKAAMKENEKILSENINWDRTVDPDGDIYSTAYVEALVGQYQKAIDTIEAYYEQAHKENLTFDNPYNHILQKYRMPDSPYYRADMSRAERELAFEQERSLLWGGKLTMGDPYALASSGGLIDSEDASRAAHQAARDKVDELIRERKESLREQEHKSN